MRFDPVELGKKLENISPLMARKLTMAALGLISPFNSHLGGRLIEWTENKAQMEVPYRRRIKNHVGSVHAGALFTVGESCAGLLIVKHFPFSEFRPLMSEVKVIYEKQAKMSVVATCEVSSALIKKAKETLKSGEIPFIPMKTIITDLKNHKIAEVHTTWQVKPWSEVRK